MSTILELDSGYSVRVPLSGPFRFDGIMQRYPMPDPVTRPIELASGDVVQTAYRCPKEEPDKSDVKEHDLWARHQAFLLESVRMQAKRNREQAHTFLLDIDVVSGPHNPISNRLITFFKWLNRALGKPLDNIALRKQHLTFLKLYVIASLDDWQKIQNAALAKEVDLESVLDAAKEMFRGELGRRDVEGSA